MQEKNITKAKQNDDEIDIVELIIMLWNHRKWIAIGTGVITFIGLLYALLASPVYRSSAIIAPKESQKGGNPSAILSQFGGLGGMVAAQLGLGNTNLDRIEIIIKGWELAESVIKNHDLLPKLFPEVWDSTRNAWDLEDSSEIPTIRTGVEALKTGLLSVEPDHNKNIIKIEINTYDSNLAAEIAEYYVDALNKKIQKDVIIEAEANQLYLSKQLNNTTDPLIREKIQNMIAFEIEKGMLVSSQSIDVLEKPVVPQKRIKPKRKRILIIFFFVGLFISIFGVMVWKFAGNMMRSRKL
jgi:uncharacterized protein involved in exopolysaccharide biosynthesis